MEIKNIRPISILCTIGNIVEKTIYLSEKTYINSLLPNICICQSPLSQT